MAIVLINMKKQTGFTLIELLIVIAIISVLASIIVTSMSSSRVGARARSAQQSLVSAKNAIIVCIQNGSEMKTPVLGDGLCDPSIDDSQVWPALPENSDWGYVVSDITTAGGIFVPAPVSNSEEGTFRFDAYSVIDDRLVTCTETGCVTQ
jgi:prepilin-type N-terminal cleavage/methylation domain-containing protein